MGIFQSLFKFSLFIFQDWARWAGRAIVSRTGGGGVGRRTGHMDISRVGVGVDGIGGGAGNRTKIIFRYVSNIPTKSSHE